MQQVQDTATYQQGLQIGQQIRAEQPKPQPAKSGGGGVFGFLEKTFGAGVVGQGVSAIQGKAPEGVPFTQQGAPGVQATARAVPDVPGWLSALLDPAFWLRIVEAILGVAFLIMGLRSLTGASNDPVALAGKLAR